MHSTKYITQEKVGLKLLGEEEKDAKFNLLYERIKTATEIRLVVRNVDDTVDGYITRYGDEIEVWLYDEDENPEQAPANDKHKSTFRKRIPTEAELNTIRGIINSL